MSDEQVPYVQSSTSYRNTGQNYEDMDQAQLSNNPSRNSSMPLPGIAEKQGRNRSFLPFSDSSLLTSIHTIILDFSMVHFVDPQASVSLRQVSTEEAFNKSQDPLLPVPARILTEHHQSLVGCYVSLGPLETWPLKTI